MPLMQFPLLVRAGICNLFVVPEIVRQSGMTVYSWVRIQTQAGQLRGEYAHLPLGPPVSPLKEVKNWWHRLYWLKMLVKSTSVLRTGG